MSGLRIDPRPGSGSSPSQKTPFRTRSRFKKARLFLASADPKRRWEGTLEGTGIVPDRKDGLHMRNPTTDPPTHGEVVITPPPPTATYLSFPHTMPRMVVEVGTVRVQVIPSGDVSMSNPPDTKLLPVQLIAY